MEHRAVRAFSASASFEQVTIGLATLLYLLPRAPIDLDWYDEGIRLYGAMRVLDGALPYHDFYAYYGPGQFYWPAALFAVFGEEALVARLGSVFFAAVGVVAVTTLLRRAGVGLTGILFAATATLLPLTTLQLYSLDPSVSLVFAAGACIVGGSSWVRLFGAGLLIGVASLFRHDFGLYGAVAAAAALAVEAGAAGLTREHLWPRLLRPILLVALGVLAIAVPVYGLLALPDPRRVLDCLVVELPRLVEYRKIPYFYSLERAIGSVFESGSPGKLIRLWVMLAPLIGLISLFGLLHRGLRDKLWQRQRGAAVIAFLGAFAAGVSVYASGRSDTPHVYPLHVVIAVALSLLGSAASRLQLAPRFRSGGVLAMAALLGAGLIGAVFAWAGRMPAPWPGARGLRVKDDTGWMTALIDDVAHYAKSGPILVTNDRHDRVHKNLMTAYFLTRRTAATYYQDVLPGFTTTPAVQARIIQDLESSQAAVVVQWTPVQPEEPNASTTEHGALLLDDYLSSHFRVENKDGYELLLRN